MKEQIEALTFIVWGVEVGCATHPKRHPTLSSALTEADRLAKLNPGQQFVTLRAIATTSAPAPEPRTQYLMG